MTPPKSKPDDPFRDDGWGPDDANETAEEEMPDASSEERPDFLKPYHLRQPQGKLELLGTGAATEYSDVVLFVQLGAKRYRMGLRTFDPGYKALLAKFGKKRSEWKGTLKYKVMPHKGRADGFVAIRPA